MIHILPAQHLPLETKSSSIVMMGRASSVTKNLVLKNPKFKQRLQKIGQSLQCTYVYCLERETKYEIASGVLMCIFLRGNQN